jgi:seryl-tRNA synthetase
VRIAFLQVHVSDCVAIYLQINFAVRRGHAIDSAAFSVLPKPRLSYRDIVDNAVYKSHNAFNRKAYLPMGAIQSIAKVWREHKDVCAQLDLKRYERNVVGEKFRNFFSGAGDQQAQDEAVEAAKEIKRIIADLEVTKVELEEKLLGLALAIPNDTHPLSPIGPDAAALTLSTHGPDPIPASPERDHVNVGRSLDLFDFESGAVSTGSSWYYLKNEGALLEMALTNYALSTAIQNGFTPFTTPDVVRADIAARCGFRPRDQPDSPTSQVYHIVTDTTLSHPSVRPEFLLAGTAEIPLAALFANKIIHTDSLPAKVVGVGKAFRAEAGARGTDARGLYRVHQFTKVELFAVTQEGASEEMMEEIRRVQVQLFEGLGIPFRSVLRSVCCVILTP